MRSRPLLLALSVAALPLLAACDGGTVTVQVLSGPPDAEGAPVEDLEVSFLPYDRDSIFQVLTERADDPEPQISDELQEDLDEVIAAQREWREAEQEWADLREELRRISRQMEGLDRRSREYLDLFQRFDELEPRVQQLERRKDRLFQRFDSLQQTTLARTDSLRAVIDSWEEEAFRGYMDITDSLMAERGVEEIPRDTTGAEGYATVNLPGGDWWVYTRTATGPYEELYWNIHVIPSETDTLILNRENAEIRMRL